LWRKNTLLDANFGILSGDENSTKKKHKHEGKACRLLPLRASADPFEMEDGLRRRRRFRLRVFHHE